MNFEKMFEDHQRRSRWHDVSVGSQDAAPYYEKGFQRLAADDNKYFISWLNREKNKTYRVAFLGGMKHIPFGVHKKLCEHLRLPTYIAKE